jgi:predicted amidophosphoribosyltransferase
MRAYRDASCAFCERGAHERCPRCEALVCDMHGAGGRPYCAVCAKELDDDLEVLRFSVTVHEPPPDSHPMWYSRDTFWSSLRQAFARVQLAFRERRALRTFEQRTPEQIAEWRRRAGLRVRGE